jgi:hypothetical protein
MVVRGDDTLAIAEVKRAHDDDPMRAVVASYRAVTLALAGRHEEAREEAERVVDPDTESYLARLISVSVYRWSGDMDRALIESRLALRMSGRAATSLAEMPGLYMAIGDRALARAEWLRWTGSPGHPSDSHGDVRWR